MAKQITDDEDRLKRQARRRLIGAVALTTAIVVILPMVLDSEPRPAGQDIELRIPDKDKAGEFVPKMGLPSVSAPVAASPVSAVTVVSAPVPAPVASPPPAPVVAPAPVPAPTPAPVAALKPVAPADVKPAPSPKPAPAPAPAKAAAPEHKPDQPKHDAKPAQAKHDAKPAEATRTEQGQPVPQSGFVVQIGAFNNADTAHSWQKNLKAQGFKAYTEKLGDKTRVRIGPYHTREEANAVRHKLEKTQHLHSNIVELN